MKKISNTFQAREYLIKHLKKQIIGPLDGHFERNVPSFQFCPNDHARHKQEILTKSPRQIYTAGILYPQKNLDNQNSNTTKDVDEEIENENPTESENSKEDSSMYENIEKDKLTEEKNQKEKEEEEEDRVESESPDNNHDVDLTNELRQSAIGISVVVNTEKSLVLGIKDVGRYHKLSKNPPKILLTACYYMSKFSKNEVSYQWFCNQFNLENSQRSTVLKFLQEISSIKHTKIKASYEDYFDKYFDNRIGWKDRVDTSLDLIAQDLKNLTKEELETNIENFLLKEFDEPQNKIFFAGYGRESLNIEVLVSAEEIIQNNHIVKKLKKNEIDLELSFSVVVRNHEDQNKKYLTISLVNTNKINGDKVLNSACFFQSNFFIKSHNNDNNLFNSFETSDLRDLTKEDQSLYLLHHNRKSYAIGHGCSVTWSNDKNNSLIISSAVIPEFETKPIKPTKFDDIKLNMKLFSEDIDFAISELKKLTNKYDLWLRKEFKKGDLFLNEIFKKNSLNNIEKCKEILKRINEGIQILEHDKNAQKAFQFMNKSMYLQQAHYKISKKDFSKEIDYQEILNKNPASPKGNWYPFQIAFILLNIKSFTSPESEDRKIMDLIWFPTGGGKTEAYLGVTAFVIFLRKLTSKNLTGCVVLMRYTLRLLTTQQFERASTLICACEKIRLENESLLGTERISIGLWIGRDSTPNTEEAAQNELSQFLDKFQDYNNKFILLNCSWCNQRLVPSERDSANIGYKIINKKLKFVCPNNLCEFSTDTNCLPVCVVDESIYKNPPSLLIGTIDKFASLPWSPEAISMLDSKEESLKPELIIQDELHLISGPLGSIAGMYEILITALTEKKINNKIISAKIIGSTATISRAEHQIKNLYGKNCSIFPGQTNQLEDSFFAYEDQNEIGRKYVGIFCPSASSPQITLAKIMSSMLLGAADLKYLSDNNEEIFDPYWTNLLYFNSIRELMSGSSLIKADVSGNISGEYLRTGITRSISGDLYKDRKRNINNIKELTSREENSQIPKTLRNLDISCVNTKECIDLCLSTNMIQVGIDIPRLGLMTIVGQPKTTSEYIQASSRVGRAKDKPGLVLTMLSPFRPRDRSHYEKFYSYENLYKFVEPTSITSHSKQVRERCLHAVVIGLARLWGKNSRLNPIVPNEELKEKIRKYILKYVEISDPDHPDEIKNTSLEIDYIFDRWESISPQVYGEMKGIADQKGITSVLMIPFGSELPEEGDPFETLTSMRNVDKECQALIIKSYGATN